MTGKAKRPGVYNVIPKPDTWAWKTKRILEHPNSDMGRIGSTKDRDTGLEGTNATIQS